MADRIAVMNAGPDRAAGRAARRSTTDPATPFVADFIGDMNHLEGTLARAASTWSAVRGRRASGSDASCARPSRCERVRSVCGPRSCTAHSRGEGVPRRARTAMVIGTRSPGRGALATGEELLAAPEPCGGRGADSLEPGDTLWLGWSPTATLLLGPVDGPETAHVDESNARSPGLTRKGTHGRPARRDQHPGPRDRRAAIEQMITRRQALLAGGGATAAAYMAGCGGSSGGGGGGGGERRRRRGVRGRARPRPTARSSPASC